MTYLPLVITTHACPRCTPQPLPTSRHTSIHSPATTVVGNDAPSCRELIDVEPERHCTSTPSARSAFGTLIRAATTSLSSM